MINNKLLKKIYYGNQYNFNLNLKEDNQILYMKYYFKLKYTFIYNTICK